MKKINGLILAGITALSLCGFVFATKPYEEKKPVIAHAASYYTITINANGGSVPYVGCLETMYYQPSDGKFYDHLHAKTGEPTGEMTVGKEFTAHWREGYLLQGYYSAATGGSIRLKGRSNTNWNYLSLDQNFVNNKPTGNMTVYARWKAREFDVTLDKQGGTGGTDSIKTTYDAAMPSITVPTKTGYSFDGYYDATSGGTKYYNANGSSARTWDKAPDITISLYAHWTAATYTVSFDHQGGTSSLTSKTVTYNANMPAISSSELPTKTAHRFDGYYDAAEGGTKYYNANGSSAKKWNKTSNATLYAHWTLLSYTVTLNQQNGTGGLSSVTAVYSQDMPTIEQANLPTREGATFGGYFAQAKGQGRQYYSDSGTSVNTWDKTSNATIYAYWIPGAEAQAVIDLIDNIGTVSYPGSKDDITAARNAYDSLSDALKSIVDDYNYATLTAAEAQYESLKQAGANAVIAKIDAIGEVSYPESGSKIDDARTSYDALTDEQKALVTNLATLEAAEAEYLAQRDAQIQAVEDEINALPEITTSNFVSDKPLVESARGNYNALTDEQKGLFDADVLASLVAKEELIATYEGEKAAGLAVKDLIDAIGEVSYPGSKDAIEGARTAYNALKNDHERSYVNNLDVLLDAEAEYESLKQAGANAVKDLIDAIGEVEYSAESKGKIDAARTAYDALTEEQKALVTNYATLTAAEARYAELVEAKAEADAVVAKIEAIGEVSYPESGIKIDDARTSYDALNSDGKSFVTNLDILEAAEDRYEELKVEGANAVKDLIDSIGNVEYSEESKDKIDAARAAYDALTEEQKELISDKELQVLINAETEYSKIQKNANILVIVLLTVACLTIAGGICFLFFLLKKKRKDDDDNDENKGKGKPVKAMSVGGFLPGVILISHYLGAPYIALYVLAGVAVLLWISILVIVIMKKKQVGPFKKKAIVAKAEPQAATTQNEDEEVETISDEKGNVFQIRYIKSFTAKLIQSSEETKKYYEELKNEALSYKKTNSRVSWHHDAINAGRNYVLKFAIRGKTLCVYLPLDADKYSETKYKVEKVDSKKFIDVPCMYRIKNDRRCDYAKDLIGEVCTSLGLQKGEEQHEVYSNLPYEPNKPLIERGLIKELKVQVNKQQEEVLSSKVNSDGDEVITTKDSKGNIFEIRYIKSFTAKLSQADDTTKNYYNILKNYVLSYKKANSRVSWHYDSINVGREQILKFAIRGKTLCLYYALDASKVEEKYKVEEAKGKKFEEVPCLYRIKNDRRCEYAKELIDLLMEKLSVSKGKEMNDEYRIPFEETKTLLAKGLIKEVKRKVTNKEEVNKPISVIEADEKMSDEEAEKEITEDLSSKEHKGKKGIINIDTIGENFNDGDVVTIEALWEKKLIPHNVGYVKVLARGTLSKKLTLDLQDYSIQAVKMVLLEGGTVKKAK